MKLNSLTSFFPIYYEVNELISLKAAKLFFILFCRFSPYFLASTLNKTLLYYDRIYNVDIIKLLCFLLA